MPDHHGAESIGATGGNRPNILWGGRDVKPPGQDRAPGGLPAPVATRRDLGRRGLPLRGTAAGDHRDRVGLVARPPAPGTTASHARGPGGGCVTSTDRSHNGTRLPGNPAQRARSPLRPGHGPGAKVPDRIADGRVAAGSARGRDGGGGGQGGRSPPFRGSKGRHAGGQPGAVAAAALAEGQSGLAAFRLTLLRPLQPMLAHTAQDIQEALRRVRPAAVEWKLDGARIQVHRLGAEVRAFTRNLADITDRVPEVVEATRRLPVEAVVLDGETIALYSDGRPHPFGVTMSRFGSRLEVENLRAKVPLSPFFLDRKSTRL